MSNKHILSDCDNFFVDPKKFFFIDETFRAGRCLEFPPTHNFAFSASSIKKLLPLNLKFWGRRLPVLEFHRPLYAKKYVIQENFEAT